MKFLRCKYYGIFIIVHVVVCNFSSKQHTSHGFQGGEEVKFLCYKYCGHLPEDAPVQNEAPV